MKFYLGVHKPQWSESTKVPLFMSVSVVKNRIKAVDHDDWIMDSGGFTALLKNGKYTISEQEYIDIIERHNPILAFSQDWMCEDFILKKTGLTIKQHQIKTVNNYVRLNNIDGRVFPVLQGWSSDDYKRCIKMYEDAGVSSKILYGLGTVCSRNSKPDEILRIVSEIKSFRPDIKLHGFGVKSKALVVCSKMLTSADSMAWSFCGRRDKLCRSCNKVSCQNCLEYGLLWRRRLLQKIKKSKKDNRF